MNFFLPPLLSYESPHKGDESKTWGSSIINPPLIT